MIEQTARIFISSTFTDMHNERDILMNRVIPSLQDRCRAINVRVLPVDLRWGITCEEAENGQVVEICLDEIDRTRPLFIGLLGERYGWIPESYQIHNQAKYGWLTKVPAGTHSITGLEILYGVLNNPQQIPQSFFYFRDPAFIEDLPPRYRVDFEVESLESFALLEELKFRIGSVFSEHPDNLMTYSCCYLGIDEARDAPLLGNLELFAEKVEEDLWQAIKQRFPMNEVVLSPVMQEVESHWNFTNQSNHNFVGCEEMLEIHRNVSPRSSHPLEPLPGSLDTIVPETRSEAFGKLLDWVTGDTREAKPLMLTGSEGSGKTAIIAKLLQTLRDRRDHIVLVPVFVGLTKGSRDLSQVYTKVVTEINVAYGTSLDANLQGGLHGFFDSIFKVIKTIESKQRMLLVIDGIERLMDGGKVPNFTHLPQFTPCNIRLLLATHIRSRPYAARKMKIYPELSLPPLSVSEQRNLVESVVGEYGKKFGCDGTGVDQMALILSKVNASNPLYLTLVCHEIRLFASYERLTDKIVSLPDDLDALLDYLLDCIELRCSREMVKIILSYVAIVEEWNTTEPVLQELLETCLDRRIEPAKWSILWRSILNFLNCGDTSQLVSSPLHRSIVQAISKRYFSSPGEVVFLDLLATALWRSWKRVSVISETGTRVICPEKLSGDNLVYRRVDFFINLCVELIENKAMQIVIRGPEAQAEQNLIESSRRHLGNLAQRVDEVVFWLTGDINQSLSDRWLFLDMRLTDLINEADRVLSGDLLRKAKTQTIQNRGREWY